MLLQTRLHLSLDTAAWLSWRLPEAGGSESLLRGPIRGSGAVSGKGLLEFQELVSYPVSLPVPPQSNS